MEFHKVASKLAFLLFFDYIMIKRHENNNKTLFSIKMTNFNFCNSMQTTQLETLLNQKKT